MINSLRTLVYLSTVILLCMCNIIMLLFSFLFIAYFYTTSGAGLGSVSDMVIAAANVAMAGAAVYAALNAKSWLSSKINDRKFAHADNIISEFSNLKNLARELNLLFISLEDSLKKIWKPYSYNIEHYDFKNEQFFIEKINQSKSLYKINIDLISQQVSNLVVWELKTNKLGIFEEILSIHNIFHDKLDETVGLIDKSIAESIKNKIHTPVKLPQLIQTTSIKRNKEIEGAFSSINSSHLKIEIPFRKLFES